MAVAAERLGGDLARAGLTVITGGGPGIMAAANKGALEAGGTSVGLGIEVPHEQGLNSYVNLGINFRYFFVRKVCFVKSSQGFIVFPGGLGKFDELFEALTLVQTKKVTRFPIVLFGSSYWQGLLDWAEQTVLAEGFISESDLSLVTVTDEGAWRIAEGDKKKIARGRGIPLMQALADRATIDSTPAGTRVRLEWNHVNAAQGVVT